MINHYLLIAKLSKLNVDASKVSIDSNSFFENLKVQDAPTLYISYKIYQLLIDEMPQKEGFEALRQLLTEYENQMDKESIALFYSYLRNYCTHLYIYGHLNLIQELHQIQKDNLEKGYFFYEENKIPSSSYQSVAATALKAKVFDWALQFIEQFKDNLLDTDGAEEVYNLNMSDYYFHIGDYDNALSLLPLSSNDLERHLRARRLEIKIYYEMNSDLLIYKIEAFKVYIHRASQKLISESNRERHNNFVNLMLQLAQLPLLDKSKAGRILARIEEKLQVAEKDWLLEKATQLVDKVK